jgi:hypothetical protein
MLYVYKCENIYSILVCLGRCPQTPEESQIRDLFKANCATENGHSIIRLLQEDVLYDRIDWWPELKKNIDDLITEENGPVMWCVESGNIYDSLITAYSA